MVVFTNGACRIYTPTSGRPVSPKFGQGGERGGDDRNRGRWIYYLLKGYIYICYAKCVQLQNVYILQLILLNVYILQAPEKMCTLGKFCCKMLTLSKFYTFGKAILLYVNTMIFFN